MSICARCEHFTTKDVPQEAAARGLYRCNGFLVAIEQPAAWDDPKCGLFRPARQMEPREKFIKSMEAKK